VSNSKSPLEGCFDLSVVSVSLPCGCISFVALIAIIILGLLDIGTVIFPAIVILAGVSLIVLLVVMII
jgi:hypothetical protein